MGDCLCDMPLCLSATVLVDTPHSAPCSVALHSPLMTHTDCCLCHTHTCREYLKPDGTIGLRSMRGWYERAENNGWRPISERILVEEDAVTTMTKLKRMPFFHFSPGVRR